MLLCCFADKSWFYLLFAVDLAWERWILLRVVWGARTVRIACAPRVIYFLLLMDVGTVLGWCFSFRRFFFIAYAAITTVLQYVLVPYRTPVLWILCCCGLLSVLTWVFDTAGWHRLPIVLYVESVWYWYYTRRMYVRMCFFRGVTVVFGCKR